MFATVATAVAASAISGSGKSHVTPLVPRISQRTWAIPPSEATTTEVPFIVTTILPDSPALMETTTVDSPLMADTTAPSPTSVMSKTPSPDIVDAKAPAPTKAPMTVPTPVIVAADAPAPTKVPTTVPV